jgi:hypothetical protein
MNGTAPSATTSVGRDVGQQMDGIALCTENSAMMMDVVKTKDQ